MGRYFNKKVEIDGIVFDSEMESKYYLLLKERIAKKEVSHLSIHRKYVLLPDFNYDGIKIKGLTYEADFVYFDHNDKRIYIEDVKGFQENEFKQQWKLLKYGISELFARIDKDEDMSKYLNFVHTTDILKLVSKSKGLPVFRIVKYSKATGFVELKDYKKAMATAKARAISEKNDAVKEKDQMKKELLTIKTLRAKETPLTKLQEEKLKELSEKYKEII
jgi:hypothetical protein